METDGQTDGILLFDYDPEAFLAHEQAYYELGAQMSARQLSSGPRGRDSFLDNMLARAWYRSHPEDRDNITHSGDEVGG